MTQRRDAMHRYFPSKGAWIKLLPGGKQFEPEEFFRRTETSQRLQGRYRLRGGGMAADSDRDTGLSLFRNSELSCATHRPFDCCRISGRARDRMGV